MNTTLTTRQKEIYNFIKSSIEQGVTPTVREIGAKCNIGSPNGVICHLKALAAKGYITRGDKSREILLKKYRVVLIPIE